MPLRFDEPEYFYDPFDNGDDGDDADFAEIEQIPYEDEFDYDDCYGHEQPDFDC